MFNFALLDKRTIYADTFESIIIIVTMITNAVNNE